ncbi:MAG: sialidase family protein [Acidobacteriota bacterium]
MEISRESGGSGSSGGVRAEILRLSGAGLLFLAAASASAAETSGPAASIHVGRNVRVSAANAERLHHEIGMAASPRDPRRLLVCSMIFDARDASRHVVVYLSTDGGARWAPTLEVQRTVFVGDPDCKFGPDGTAFFSALALRYESAADHETLIYRSPDGGATWSEPTVLPFIDREYLTIDATAGARKGRVYLHGNAVRDPTVDGDERIVFTLYRSDDGAKSFGAPSKIFSDGDHMPFGTGNSVALSDGTYLVPFYEWNDRKNLSPDPESDKAAGSIKLLRSEDGGERFGKAVVVSEWHQCFGWTPGMPYLAADTSGGPFQDRVYAVWPDRRSGRCEIVSSYSSDKGKSWSAPSTVNDDQSPRDRERGRDHSIPAVAVNKSGIVGVSWYDRRDSSDNVGGWLARFAASSDGGDTFSPSVRVAEAPQEFREGQPIPIMASSSGGGHHRPRARGGNIQMEIGPQYIDYLAAADTGGLAADADGAFHPIWIDNRTGVGQLWTAEVRVDGRAAVNGSEELAKLFDRTQSVAVDFSNTAYDPASRVVSLDAALTNTSDKPLTGPVRLRVVSVHSGSAVVRIVETENGLSGAGAVWDFTPSLKNGRLAPGETSRPRRLKFQLNELAPFRLDKRHRLDGLISVQAKVLAGGEAP